MPNHDRYPPIPYAPNVEQPAEDEQETIAGLIKALTSIADTTFRDYGAGIRSVHAKCHGLVLGELRVEEGLDAQLAQGLFARPRRYPVVVRFSTSPGDPIHDNVSLPRAMAIKVIGVEGERVSSGSSDVTQDFVMVNGPVFLKPTAKAFLKNLALLAKTTDRAEGAKKALSAVLRGTEKALEALGGESSTIKALGGQPRTHLLGETFFTQVPLRFGEYIAKCSLAPVSDALRKLTDVELPADDNPFQLRDATSAYFAGNGAEWELRAQLCVDLEQMPIEDASALWSEEHSPYRTVARLYVPRQSSWMGEVSEELERRLSFSPWHALQSHQPLGSVMRARRQVYAVMAEQRAARNGVSIAEPSSLADLRWLDAPLVKSLEDRISAQDP